MRATIIGIAVLAGALGIAPACSNQQPTQAVEAAVENDAEAQPVAADAFVGEVVETMDAGPYTYVRVTSGEDEIWAAANHFQVAVGDRVTVPLTMEMTDFHSDSLDRDFDVIYFADQIIHEGVPVPGMPPGHPQVTGPATVSGEAISVERAPGGATIAELWADKDTLAGSTVTVRGKVVKFNPAILDTNWIHLQDGTGDPAAGTHDITITTSDVVRVGDVVKATGTLVLDKDFGAGYTYPVLIQAAEIEE